MKKIGWVLIGVVILLLLAGGGFAIFTTLNTAGPQPQALAAMQSTDSVAVTSDEWLVFTPKNDRPTTGFVFYPGGLVDPRAYAPMAQDIAAEGYLVVIVPMPFNLAVFGSNRATDVIEAFPEIEKWAIGGHSLGGAMASRYAHQHTEAVSGLVLWAAYPDEAHDLTQVELDVASIFGTRDGLVSLEQIESSSRLLPPDTDFVAIEGGNHAQFGWYGPQEGDLPATISHAEQHSQTVAATLAVLTQLQQHLILLR